MDTAALCTDSGKHVTVMSPLHHVSRRSIFNYTHRRCALPPQLRTHTSILYVRECSNLVTCWKPSLSHCTFLLWQCGFRLRLRAAMGRADTSVIWNDLVLQSKPPLVGCSQVTAHFGCVIYLWSTSHRICQHTLKTLWMPSFFRKRALHIRVAGKGGGGLCWLAGGGGAGCVDSRLSAVLEPNMETFVLLRYMAHGCATVKTGHWNPTCPPFIDL